VIPRALRSRTQICSQTFAQWGEAVQLTRDDIGIQLASALSRIWGLIGAWLTLLYFRYTALRDVAARLPHASCALAPRLFTSIVERSPPRQILRMNSGVRKIADKEIEGLDLSSWRAALNGRNR